MPDGAVCSDVSSHILSKSKGNINESVCEKCSEYETKLKEDLAELGSAGTIIELLQKELLTSTTKYACGNDLVSTEGSAKQVNTKEWTPVLSKNYIAKPNKRDKCKTAASGQLTTTTNRFTQLSNLEVNNSNSIGLQEQSEWISTQNMHKTKKQHRIGIKIPTIVNGRITHNDDRNPTAARRKRHVYLALISTRNIKGKLCVIVISEELLQG